MLSFQSNRHFVSFSVINAGQFETSRENSHKNGLKLLFVLSGTSTVTIGISRYQVSETDLLLVNSGEFYYVHPQENFYYLSLFIPDSLIKQNMADSALPFFNCRKLAEDENFKPQKEIIRHLYADLFHLFYKNKQDDTVQVYGCVHKLLSLLIRNFLMETVSLPCTDSLRQLDAIIPVIHENFRGPISLASLADKNYLSASALSRSFRQAFGMTFTEYITSLRLNSALSDLKSTDKTITRIALDNGFPNTNAFISSFCRQYGVTPGKYKKQYSKSSKTTEIFHKSDLFQSLLCFETPRTVSEDTDIRRFDYTVSTKKPSRSFAHNWKKLLNVAYASDLLTCPVQQKIREIQQEYHFQYLHFQGLLNDDMMIYHERADGTPLLNFALADIIFDFVLSVDLIPYVEFSYMPQLLSKYKERHFTTGSLMSVPADMDKWLFLIRSFVRHFQERYGRFTVGQWIFSIFSINVSFLGEHNDFEEYCECFLKTSRLLKELEPSCRIAGPSSYASGTWKDQYLRMFLNFCRNNSCFPDLFSFYCYPYQTLTIKDVYDTIQSGINPYPDSLSDDEDFVLHAIQYQSRLLQEYGIENPQIILEEWNSTMWQRDYANDCCFKSAYLVKNIVENHASVFAMGYWALLDFMKELEPSSLPFQGGYGLYTFQGIPKAAAVSLKFLNRLGNQVLFSAEGCTVTKSENQIQIILYHYCHYDGLYRHHFNIAGNQDIYGCFTEKKKLIFHLSFSDLPPAPYRLRRYGISRRHGSPYDCWISMGSPLYLTKEELRILTCSAEPSYCREDIPLSDGPLSITAELSPHEVQLLILDFMG